MNVLGVVMFFLRVWYRIRLLVTRGMFFAYGAWHGVLMRATRAFALRLRRGCCRGCVFYHKAVYRAF